MIELFLKQTGDLFWERGDEGLHHVYDLSTFEEWRKNLTFTFLFDNVITYGDSDSYRRHVVGVLYVVGVISRNERLLGNFCFFVELNTAARKTRSANTF